MRRLGATACATLTVLASLALVSCGGSAKSTGTEANPSLARSGAIAKAMEGRLRAHGYTVAEDKGASTSQPYEQTFSVENVDWTTPRAFNVTVYLFPSTVQAAAYARKFTRSVGRFPQSNRPKVVGRHLFVGASDLAGVRCTIVNGSPSCPAPPAVPRADFEKLISIAEGR
jgi:hypothetical protein